MKLQALVLLDLFQTIFPEYLLKIYPQFPREIRRVDLNIHSKVFFRYIYILFLDSYVFVMKHRMEKIKNLI